MPTEPFLDIILTNHTDSESLFAHVTGRDEQGVLILLADGETVHRPKSPSEILQPVGADIAIPVGGPGAQKKVRIPHIFGGRIWFCKGKPITFLINPGPAVVEPSVTNPTDANFDADWGFCEFTYNNDQLYVNVSYVDFVSIPIGLELENEAGQVTRVPGMPKDGLDQVSEALKRQGEKDGAGWEKLVVKSKSGFNLRVLSPNAGAELHPGLLENYFAPEIDAAWKRYEKEDIEINTQAEWGDVRGRVHDGKLVFKDVGKDKLSFHFEKPATRDIVSCSTGPFAGGPDVTAAQLNVGARLVAALNRTTLSGNSRQPEGERVEEYYCKGKGTTNHYSRICHEVTREGKGYAFPYDDVGASGGVDQSGFLNDGRPKVLTVHVGGQ
ncbi:beta-1,3-glucanase [Fusarium bulbicola]|uniref:Beta-1,3-glucanase n=1 Tax=Fusarium circinatum TaxID=48490 RepID=A0A8H5X6U7_FUSCI|nr:beta-1,3-glucanase [Fusarium circinatum]KAF5972754.1 beta-1,3-glucanase [Fusarium bulbicola]